MALSICVPVNLLLTLSPLHLFVRVLISLTEMREDSYEAPCCISGWKLVPDTIYGPLFNLFDGQFRLLAAGGLGGDVRRAGMAGLGIVGRGQRVSLLTNIFFLLVGSAEADAAYRLISQNGTSVEVQPYEDLGDSIRYLRLGGTVVVPKSSLSTIEEAVHLPPPIPPPTVPAVNLPSVPGRWKQHSPSGHIPLEHPWPWPVG